MSSLTNPVIPRRLAQPHGSYYNAILSPNIAVTRKYGSRNLANRKVGKQVPLKMTKMKDRDNMAEKNKIDKLNANLSFTANDEVFDIRAGEPLVSSFSESGYSPHGRGFVFSSVNGYQSLTGEEDPNEALYQSDCQFAGLCQSDFVSSNTALQQQGLSVQAGGIKTIINDCGQTIHMGDKLMLHIPEHPGNGRRGVPLEKVRFSLKPVPADFIEKTVIPRMIDEIPKADFARLKLPANFFAANGPLAKMAPYMIASFRKSARLVVAKAVSSARPDHQVDIKLTAPSFV